MPTPTPRTALDRLVEEGRVLHTCCRLILSDVDEAYRDDATPREVALALGLSVDRLPEVLDEELATIGRWAT